MWGFFPSVKYKQNSDLRKAFSFILSTCELLSFIKVYASGNPEQAAQVPPL